MNLSKKISLTVLVLAIGGAAFRLSFDAQVTLAVASGIDASLGWLYPAVVDAAILTGVLMRIWFPHAGKALHWYLWGAIAFWTITSILGNAFHVVALPDGRITVPIALAVAVNTVPALTLFLIIHLVATITDKPSAAPARAGKVPPRPPKTQRSVTAASTSTATPARDVPPVTDEQLLAMAETKSVREIAATIGRGKTYVSDRLQRIREQATEEASA
jgi:hypothetical protein